MRKASFLFKILILVLLINALFEFIAPKEGAKQSKKSKSIKKRFPFKYKRQRSISPVTLGGKPIQEADKNRGKKGLGDISSFKSGYKLGLLDLKKKKLAKKRQRLNASKEARKDNALKSEGFKLMLEKIDDPSLLTKKSIKGALKSVRWQKKSEEAVVVPRVGVFGTEPSYDKEKYELLLKNLLPERDEKKLQKEVDNLAKDVESLEKGVGLSGQKEVTGKLGRSGKILATHKKILGSSTGLAVGGIGIAGSFASMATAPGGAAVLGAVGIGTSAISNQENQEEQDKSSGLLADTKLNKESFGPNQSSFSSGNLSQEVFANPEGSHLNGGQDISIKNINVQDKDLPSSNKDQGLKSKNESDWDEGLEEYLLEIESFF